MKKNTILTVLITLMVSVVLVLACLSKKMYSEINTYYQIYLNGDKIGIIDDKEQLYNLIDSNQSAIKYEYKVDNVYPPTDLKIVATNTYIDYLDNVNSVYNKIEENDDFTIKGYVVTIKGKDKEYKVNVLNKEIFYDAAKRFVRAFLDEDEYEKYINNNQAKIVDTGHIIKSMKFEEDITIKEAYISVKEKIYVDELDLVQFLLFGSDPQTKSYTVKLGDTIESVADSNKLSVEEFLIANTKYKSSDAILRVNDKVNVTLIVPQLTFVYDLYAIKDETVYFVNEPVYDKTKPTTYKEVTQSGQNGIDRYEETYSVTNGVRSQEAELTKLATIRDVRNQITTIGTRVDNPILPPNPVIVDGYWAWPTNKGYVITSGYGWRWGTHHSAIDISGTGFGSPIYSVADGVVIQINNSCPDRGTGVGDQCGGSFGNQIVIQHENGYYTRYAHLTRNVRVSVGQSVTKGATIGYMGSSGSSSGSHLHFAVAKDSPTNYFNPMSLYR